jgi:hypothetical protein
MLDGSWGRCSESGTGFSSRGWKPFSGPAARHEALMRGMLCGATAALESFLLGASPAEWVAISP